MRYERDRPQKLEAFWQRHPETKQPLRAWLTAAKTQNWANMNNVESTYSKAIPINAERCVFDVCSGNYRLISHSNLHPAPRPSSSWARMHSTIASMPRPSRSPKRQT
jgi:mRNA-degrading endonuclease HigB of HigAB toxin-antitoxin module